jgi:hypothetical protein
MHRVSICGYACIIIYILFGILTSESKYIAHHAASVYPKSDWSITEYLKAGNQSWK